MEEDVERGVREERLRRDAPAAVGEEDGERAQPRAARRGQRGQRPQRHRRVGREPADDDVPALDRRPVRRLIKDGEETEVNFSRHNGWTARVSVEGNANKAEEDACYFVELGDDGEDEGEHAEQRGGEAELRALAQSHGAGPGRSVTFAWIKDGPAPAAAALICRPGPGSIGVPENGNGTGSRLT